MIQTPNIMVELNVVSCFNVFYVVFYVVSRVEYSQFVRVHVVLNNDIHVVQYFMVYAMLFIMLFLQCVHKFMFYFQREEAVSWWGLHGLSPLSSLCQCYICQNKLWWMVKHNAG